MQPYRSRVCGILLGVEALGRLGVGKGCLRKEVSKTKHFALVYAKLLIGFVVLTLFVRYTEQFGEKKKGVRRLNRRLFAASSDDL